MRMFAVSFADQVRAEVVDITLSNTYEGMQGGRRSGGTACELELLKEKQEQIRTGNLKGIFCFDAELVDDISEELDYSKKPFRFVRKVMGRCFKDMLLRVTLAITSQEQDGEYRIVLERYQSSKELWGISLGYLVCDMVEKLRFEDIKDYCEFHKWSELE
jgi:hypothetical protein